MSAIQLTITDTASEFAKQLRPEVLLPVLAKVIDAENLKTVSHIQKNYLSFPGHGPTTMAGLRARSTNYRNTLHSSSATIEGSEIHSGIGSPMKKDGFSYPALHEFGGTVHHPARRSSVRLRETARGELMRQGKNGRLAIFARKSHTRARTVQTENKAYTAEYPARAPIQKGIADRAEKYTEALSNKILSLGGAS